MSRAELKKHLKSRHLNLSLYSGTAVTSRDATFILWNLSGRMVGYQVYNPSLPKVQSNDPRECKYFTDVSKLGRGSELAVWGLETYRQDKDLFLCEGIFDACRLHNAGISAIAVLGSNPIHLREWLTTLPNKIIAVVQGDRPGKKLAKYGDEAIYLPEGKDVGDLTKAEFKSIFSDYIDPKGPAVFYKT